MKIYMASSEIFPLAKTGGLADMVGGLARTLVRSGVEVTLVTPAYQSSLDNFPDIERTSIEFDVPIANRRVAAQVFRTSLTHDLNVYLIAGGEYFSRPGLYGTSASDYPDNAERFVFFATAALSLAHETGPWDLLHAHDWQTALIPVLKKARPRLYPGLQMSKDLLTIHNIAYQGLFPPAFWELLNLDPVYFTASRLEFFGLINFLKGGIVFADGITTVSQKYAQEIMTPEYGFGLDGVIRDRQSRLVGILNGVDYEEWDPATDVHLRKNYKPGNLRGKRLCKIDLQSRFSLPARTMVPLFGLVSRLVDQKGLDLIAEILEELFQLDLQIVVLGTGDVKYQELFVDLARRYPAQLGVKIGFDNALAHKIEGGADFFLMPSKYEPCGLNQMYSLKYGTIPIVRATGGLDDTVGDFDPQRVSGNGIKFTAYSGAVLLEAVKRAIALYTNRSLWSQLLAAAMNADFSWHRSAAEYANLYEKIARNQPLAVDETA
jgi:starch synthase